MNVPPYKTLCGTGTDPVDAAEMLDQRVNEHLADGWVFYGPQNSTTWDSGERIAIFQPMVKPNEVVVVMGGANNEEEEEENWGGHKPGSPYLN